MNVRELIEKLKEYDDDTIVFVYEPRYQYDVANLTSVDKYTGKDSEYLSAVVLR